MRMKNPTSKPIRVRMDVSAAEPPVILEVGPGEVCEIPDAYCEVTGGRRVIDMIGPGLVPAPKEKVKPAPHAKSAEKSEKSEKRPKLRRGRFGSDKA